MLTISAKDFGPIIEGTVTLKPLTIFVGPSNSGKSYMATLIYSLLKSATPYHRISYQYALGSRRFLPPFYRRGYPFAGDFDTAITDPVVKRAARQWAKGLADGNNGLANVAFSSLPERVQKAVNEIVDKSISMSGREMARGLPRYFGDAQELGRKSSGVSQLQVEMSQDSPRFRLLLGAKGGELGVQTRDSDLGGTTLAMPGEGEHVRHVASRSDYLLDTLVESTLGAVYEDLSRDSYYLPAARSGIAQGHKAIASILVRQSSLAAIEPLEIPTLAAIITDFIGNIITLDRVRPRPDTRLARVIEFMESHVLQGRVDIEQVENLPYPEIFYEPITPGDSMGKFPLPRTSSMVSELAPVLLYFKYLVLPGDFVVLEEPESHLHPAIQRQMARAIVRLVNSGVQVLITTHSDYFVGQLNNLVRLASVNASKMYRQGYQNADRLSPDDVSVFSFALNEPHEGSRITQLPMLDEWGIPEEEFARVSEDLYGESLSLQRRPSLR